MSALPAREASARAVAPDILLAVARVLLHNNHSSSGALQVGVVDVHSGVLPIVAHHLASIEGYVFSWHWPGGVINNPMLLKSLSKCT